MKIHPEDLIKHATTVFNFYKVELGSPPDVQWLIHPRDFYFLKAEFKEPKIETGEMPTLFKIPALVAYTWRKLPIIAVSIRDVDKIKNAHQ